MALTAVTALIIGAVFLLRSSTRPAPAPVAAAEVSDVAVASASKPEPVSRMSAVIPVPAQVQPSAEEKRLIASQKIEQLQVWAQMEDASGLANIMSELATNTESKVRLAAITLAKQSGNREIIPALKDAAERAEDLKEKAALLNAADFLAQPTLSEQLSNPQPMVTASR